MMLRHRTLIACTALLLAAGSSRAWADPPAAAPAGSPATAPATQPNAKRVTNLWVDTDIRQVIQDIASQTDTVIVCDQTVQGSLSMSVKDMPLTDCLERVCAAGGYGILPIKDYYVIGRSDPGAPMFQRFSEPQRVKLSNVVPEQVKSMLHPSLAPYVTCDKVGGAVLVTAPPAVRQRIVDALKLIDQPNPQVAIEAVVFELTEDGSKDLGLDWHFNSGLFSGSSTSLVNTIAYGPASDLGTFVDMTLRAIVQSRKGQVLANPRILVVNNTEAEIFVGQEKYFTLLSGQASNPYYTLQSIKSGVTLKVAPYIGENGQITLNLEPEVSDVVTDPDINAASTAQDTTTAPLPVVTRRHAKTTVNIQDGQTILLGGLLLEQHRSIVSKVPVAGDIPGLGAAFRNIQEEKDQQEVVILITAHLVDGRKSGLDTIASRLEQHYVTPLDAIAVPQQGAAK